MRLLFLLLSTFPCVGDEIELNPNIVLPSDAIIIFPNDSNPVPPEPKPEPDITTTLNTDEVFVVQSNVELMLRKFGTGEINILETTGPKSFPAKFTSGNGTLEVKEFKLPYLYFITASKQGIVTIDFIPSGLTKAHQHKIRRQILTIPGAPQPPPEPEPTPLPVPPKPIPPEPTPEPDVSVEKVHLSIVYDTRNVSQPTATVLNGLYGWSAFIGADNTYLLYDITTKEDKGKTAITDTQTAMVQYPSLTIRDKATDNLLLVTSLPLTTADFKKVVNTFLKVPL
jgi:hypothetical protein